VAEEDQKLISVSAGAGEASASAVCTAPLSPVFFGVEGFSIVYNFL
jgi:hypothetical protein